MKIIAKTNGRLCVSLETLCNSSPSLENFLIDRDGALCKRNGYEKLLTLSFSPRSAYSVSSDSVHLVLMDYVSTVDLERLAENTPYEPEALPPQADSSVVRSGDEIIVFNGGGVQLVKNGRVTAVSGYVPLCAKNWECGKKGEIFEPLNLLSNHFRATYAYTGDDNRLYLPFSAECIDCIRYNGYTVGDDEYELSADGSYVDCHFFDDVGSVAVYASLGEGFVTDSDIARCLGASCAGDESSTLYVFRSSREGNETKAYYSSAEHAPTDAFANSLYGVNSKLCIFEGDEFMLASGKEIRAVFPFSDKSLIFSFDECYLKESEESPTLLFAGAGCANNMSAILRENTAVFSGINGIFCLTPSEKKENTRLERLCLPEQFPERFLSDAYLCYDSTADLLYVYNRYRDAGVFVYSFETGILSHFTGLSPHLIFCVGRKTYFTTGNELFAFSDALSCDHTEDARYPIKASFYSGILDFGEAFAEKKLELVSLRASGAGRPVISLQLDGNKNAVFALSSDGKAFPSVFTRKTRPHRFHSARLTVTDGSDSALRITSLEIRSRALTRK